MGRGQSWVSLSITNIMSAPGPLLQAHEGPLELWV